MTDAAGPILCFGEILWDFLPDAAYPGGAPLNVAYHLRHLGRRAWIVSAAGRDLLGDELFRRLRHWGLATDGVARRPRLPTGTVQAALAAGGDARYTIARAVAWDRIALRPVVRRASAAAAAVVFGSLAQRSAGNRLVLDRLLATVPAAALRVFDVNLRPPHNNLDRVRRLARRATLLKLNAEEAARLAARSGHAETLARTLADRTGCPLVCITAGARGAGLLRAGRWHWEPGRPVAVVDTVGAGDAFLAALVDALLEDRLPERAMLARACRLGEWVAGRRGAMPAYDASAPV